MSLEPTHNNVQPVIEQDKYSVVSTLYGTVQRPTPRYTTIDGFTTQDTVVFDATGYSIIPKTKTCDNAADHSIILDSIIVCDNPMYSD